LWIYGLEIIKNWSWTRSNYKKFRFYNKNCFKFCWYPKGSTTWISLCSFNRQRIWINI